MYWLIELDLAADAGRGQHAERATDHGGFVGENVAEKVLGEHHIVARRSGDQLHGEGIDVAVIQLDVGILLADFGHRATPELRRFQHVGLVDRSDVILAATGFLKCDV